MGYETQEIAGQVVDVLTVGDLQISVTRVGAEMISLRRAGTGFLYRDGDLTVPASGWKNHAILMGYFIHRLKREQTTYRGEEIKGGTHSFLRHKTFAAPKVRADALVYTLTEADIEAEEYPLPVDFQITYRLSAEQLIVEVRFENHAPDLTAHVSFGLHPGWACGTLLDGEVWLPQGKYRRYLAPENFLSGEVVDFHHEAGPMPFSHAELPGSFLLEWLDVPQKIITFTDRSSGKKVEMDYTEAPYVTLWSDGGSYICVEPCWGLPDHHVQRPFEEKLGLQVIPPQGILQKSFSLKPILP